MNSDTLPCMIRLCSTVMMWLALFAVYAGAQQSAGFNSPSRGATDAQSKAAAQPDVNNPWHIAMEDGVPVCKVQLKPAEYPPGVYGIGREAGVRPPVPTHQVDAEFSDEARRFGRKPHHQSEWVVWMGFTVDEHGKPKDVCVTQKAGLGLDQKAIEATEKYRFNPAMLHGKPVAVRLTMEVSFRLK